jgi:outer membrane protein
VKSTTIFLILLLTARIAGAQSSPAVREITLGEAIRLALEKNYTTAALDVNRSELERTRAGDNLLPSVSGRSSYSYAQSFKKITEYSFDQDSNLIGTKRAADPYHSMSYSLDAGFNIYSGGGDAARIRAAARQLDASRYTLKWTRQSVALDVSRYFVNALRTKELMRSAEKTYAQTKAQLDRIRGLYEAGAVPVGQVYQQEAQLGQQELDLIAARNDYENAKSDLFYVMNVPLSVYQSYEVSPSGLDTSASSLRAKAASVVPTAAELENIISTREDFASQRSLISAQEASIDITRSALLPRLDASASIGGSGARFGSDIERTQFSNSYGAGLSLSIPIFDKMQNRILIEQQQIDLQISRIRLEQQEQQYRAEASKAVNVLRNAERAVDASERALKAAEESLRSAEERLKVGAGIQTDVIVAQATIQAARTNNVNAVYSLLYAQKQLEYLLGKWNY